MRDEFGNLGARLRDETGRAAAAVTPRPAEEIRRRGDQRRRTARLSAGLAVAVLILGTGGIYAAAGHLRGPARTAPVTSHSPAPPPRHPRSAHLMPDDEITSLSCTSAADCWGVGASLQTDRSLIARWDGARWSARPGLVPPAVRTGSLNAVSCPAPGDCWAVGDTIPTTGAARNWSLHWTAANGPELVPLASVRSGAMRLNAISCVSPQDCWAVGYAYSGASQPTGPYTTLAEQFRLGAWSVVPTPSVGRDSGLGSVSCATSTDCWATGTWEKPRGAGGGTLTEHWDGSAWSLAATPTTHSGTPTWAPGQQAPPYMNFGATMNALSCPAPNACVAVGNGSYDGVPSLSPAGQALGGSTALTQRWNGAAWSNVTTTKQAGANVTVLLSVSCTGPSWCMAAGWWAPRNGPSRTLTERWNGSSWALVPVPSPVSIDGSQLGAVSCTSPANCWASGSTTSSFFLEHWNGTRWDMAP